MRIPGSICVLLACVPSRASADECGAPGRWEPVAALPLPGRVDHTAVWTGREMILWGGTQGADAPRSDGARYDPAADAWTATDDDRAPVERDDHAAVWTGREMIVWGGNSYSEDDYKLDDGARYDVKNDRWRALPTAPLTARDDPRAVWTGSAMLVWGGRDADGHTGDGAAFYPGRDRWLPLAAKGAPQPREDHIAVWTGREMIIWGGWNGDDDARNYALDGARYDPARSRWRKMSSKDAPPPREDASAIWTGRELIVWGGVIRDAEGERHQVASGGRYDPATDTWSPLPTRGAPSPREDGVVVWTGDEMIVWGGQQGDVPVATGARYLPAADRWCPLPARGAPVARRDHAGVWTGDALVIWGGQDADGTFPADGARLVLTPRVAAGSPGSPARSRPR